MTELKDFATAELVAELIRRKKISAHTLVSMDKMYVGRRLEAGETPDEPVGVVFSTDKKVRLVLNLPDFEINTSENKPIEDYLTAEALHENVVWYFEKEDRRVRF